MTFLDSDTFTLAFHGHPVVRPRLEAAIARRGVAVSVFVRAEALRGRLDAVLKAAQPEDIVRMQDRLHETEELLARMPVVPFDNAAGQHFLKLSKMKSLKKTGYADLLIACVSLAHDATLATRNTKDFAGIPNLKLENWAI